MKGLLRFLEAFTIGLEERAEQVELGIMILCILFSSITLLALVQNVLWAKVIVTAIVTMDLMMRLAELYFKLKSANKNKQEQNQEEN